jgi:hypothetical protein
VGSELLNNALTNCNIFVSYSAMRAQKLNDPEEKEAKLLICYTACENYVQVSHHPGPLQGGSVGPMVLGPGHSGGSRADV